LHKNAFGGPAGGAIAPPRPVSRCKGEWREGIGRKGLGVWRGRKGMEGKDVRKSGGMVRGREEAEKGERE